MEKNKHSSFEEVDRRLPFGTPDNYFNNFALGIEKQIGYKKISSRFLKSWMYVAAIFVGLFVLGGVFYQTNKRVVNSTAESYESYVMAQVDETAVIDYYVNDYSN